MRYLAASALIRRMELIAKLAQARERFEEIQVAMADPSIVSDAGKYAALSRESSFSSEAARGGPGHSRGYSYGRIATLAGTKLN